MAHKPRPKSYKLTLDGKWTLVDFYGFPRAYLQVYSFLYTFGISDFGVDEERLEWASVAFPWRGGYSAVNFYDNLRRLIPPAHQPQVKAIQYGSPGFMELSLAVAIAIGVRRLVNEVARSLETANHAYNEIYKGLQERELLRLKVEKARLEVEREHLKFVKKANRTMAQVLGIKNVARITQLTGSRLITLKIMLSLYRRIRDLADYKKKGKVTF